MREESSLRIAYLQCQCDSTLLQSDHGRLLEVRVLQPVFLDALQQPLQVGFVLGHGVRKLLYDLYACFGRVVCHF